LAVTQPPNGREISPYFSRSKNTTRESRLKEIAQNIKKAATDKEAGKQTKTAIARSYELSD
jgi:hypothetical protein